MALLARLCWKKVSETQAGIEPTTSRLVFNLIICLYALVLVIYLHCVINTDLVPLMDVILRRNI